MNGFRKGGDRLCDLKSTTGRCLFKLISHALPHPEVPRSGLEGGLQNPLRELEGSFEAFAALRHLRMRWSAGDDELKPSARSFPGLFERHEAV